MTTKNTKTNLPQEKGFWARLKWLFKELLMIYSPKNSFFSKKRIESGIAFIIAQWGMIFFLLMKYQDLTMGEFLLWATAEFAVSGYMIHKIEKSKKIDTPKDETE